MFNLSPRTIRLARFPFIIGTFIVVYSTGYHYKEMFWKEELDTVRERNKKLSERNRQVRLMMQEEQVKGNP